MVEECTMPVVDMSYNGLEQLVGRSKKEISNVLPYLGLDIESEDGDLVRVEYSPNRPDYSTEFGISLGLQGLLDVCTGPVIPKFDKPQITLKVDPSVSDVRPYVVGLIARGGRCTTSMISQIIDMQEDLHLGIGRKRTKASIGIHDMSKVTPPLLYSIVDSDHRFKPLGYDMMDVGAVLTETEIGRQYGHLVDRNKVPIILDANGTISLPPIINADSTALNTDTRDLLVEITGTNQSSIHDVFHVIAITLHAAGFSLEPLDISGGDNQTPKPEPRTISIKPNIVNDTLGLNLDASQIIKSLQRARLGATRDGDYIQCVIPPFRSDIFGIMDIVEEVALGYGIANLKPTLPSSSTIGQQNSISNMLARISRLMVGLGYFEVLNSSLTSSQMLYDLTGRNSNDFISVLDPKSHQHEILRDSLLPGIIDNLARNIHEPYPQRLFETGSVFLTDDMSVDTKRDNISEILHLAGASSYSGANFAEIKSILQSVLDIGFGVSIKTHSFDDPMFTPGRCAAVDLDGDTIGVLGEISSGVLQKCKIRVPVVAFEVSIEFQSLLY